MAYPEWLEKSLQAAIARKGIGAPVALRAFLQLTPDHGLLLPVLAHGVQMAERWFGSPLKQLYAQGAVEAGYLTALAEYQRGQTALISAETCRSEDPMVLVLLVGNRGTLQFEDKPDLAPLVPGDIPVRTLIEKSLRSGQPVQGARDG